MKIKQILFKFGPIKIIGWIAAIAAAIFTGQKVFVDGTYQADNPYEEVVESVIEQTLKLPDGTIDASTETPEGNND